MGFHFPFLGVSRDEHDLSVCPTPSSMPQVLLDSTSVTVYFMKACGMCLVFKQFWACKHFRFFKCFLLCFGFQKMLMLDEHNALMAYTLARKYFALGVKVI